MKPKIGIVYYIPVNSLKYRCWNDGFVAAVKILEKEFKVSWFNVDENISISQLNTCDLLLAKSNWKWVVDNYIQRKRNDISAPIMILISGSNPVPSRKHISIYTHLFYETPWYSKFIPSGISANLAFGTNTELYYPKIVALNYDYISIGALRYYKRHHYLLKKNGSRIVVGDCNTPEASFLIEIFRKNKIKVRDYQPPEKLNDLINASNTVYIPAELHGGGERALMEAIACGKEIEIKKDNPKLKSLMELPLLDHHYYAEQIRKHIVKVI